MSLEILPPVAGQLWRLLGQSRIRTLTVAGGAPWKERPSSVSSLCLPLDANLAFLPLPAPPTVASAVTGVLLRPLVLRQLPDLQGTAFQSVPAQPDPFKAGLTSVFSFGALLGAEAGMPGNLHKGSWASGLNKRLPLGQFCTGSETFKGRTVMLMLLLGALDKP